MKYHARLQKAKQRVAELAVISERRESRYVQRLDGSKPEDDDGASPMPGERVTLHRIVYPFEG